LTLCKSSTYFLNFSHDRSSWSSPSVHSITFQTFPGISDLLSEVSQFQHHKMLYPKCSMSLLSVLIIANLLENAAFVITILDLFSRGHTPHHLLSRCPNCVTHRVLEVVFTAVEVSM
jgi:hypothetical protein